MHGSPSRTELQDRLALERILQPELDLPAAVDRQREVPEIRVCQLEDVGRQIRNIGKEICVVEGVEELGTERQFVPFMDLKRSRNAGVVEPLSRPYERIATHVSLHAHCGDDEMKRRRRLSNAPWGPSHAGQERPENSAWCRGYSKLRAVYPNGRKWRRNVSETWPVIPAVTIVIEINPVRDGFWTAGLRRERAGPTPAPGNVTQYIECLVTRRMDVRQVPNIGAHKAVPMVIGGQTAIRRLAVNDLGERTAARCLEHFGSVIDQLRIRVRPAQEQAMRELAIQGELPGVIDRIAAVVSNDNRAKVVVQPRNAAGSRISTAIPWIKFLTGEQVLPTRADISRRKDKSTRQLSLDVQVPLVSQRIAQVARDSIDRREGIRSGRRRRERAKSIRNASPGFRS